MGRHCKSQSHIHAAGVAFDRIFNELFNPGEINNSIELSLYFGLGHTQYSAAQIDIFPACELRMKARPDLEQRSYVSVNLHDSSRRFGDAGKYLEQCAFSGAIAANNANYLTRTNLE